MVVAKNRYRVITQHGADRKVRVRRFPTYEAAEAWVGANTPDTDDAMVPSLDDDVVAGLGGTYERGVYWHDNRYAIIARTVGTRPADW